VNLRIFADDQGKDEPLGARYRRHNSRCLTVHSVRRRARPAQASFIQAAPPELGKTLYDEFVVALRTLGVRVETGVFQAHMSLDLTNDGPVTILLDSDKTF